MEPRRLTQPIRVDMQALDGLEFDGANRIFECPVGYTCNCDRGSDTCTYYSKRDSGEGTCAVPFLLAFFSPAAA